MAAIYSLVYRPSDEHPADHYARTSLYSARLIAGHGIEGDLNGGGHPDRNLNIMSYETLERLKGEGFSTQPGEMGEQVIVRGLDVNVLPAGTRLKFGENAVIEVVKPRTGCDRFEAIQGKPSTAAAGRMGVMARVITGGDVRSGDSVSVLETAGK